jgi:Nucleotidyl transferase AbiEii toxin, Type IV TA system
MACCWEGGYAFGAHEIVHRPSQDLDFATSDDTPLPEIAEDVRDAFQRAGYGVRLAEAASRRYARLVLQLPGSGEELEMDLGKEALEPRWVTVQVTPAASVRAVSFDDTVGLKARAWHDRGSRICATGSQAGMTTSAAASPLTLPARRPQMTSDQCLRREAGSLLEASGETKCVVIADAAGLAHVGM